jgi:hypothetical protein
VREENLASMKEQLERDPAVESVDYNYVRHLSNAPNDPRFDEQWGMTKPRFEDVRSRDPPPGDKDSRRRHRGRHQPPGSQA